MKNFSKILSVLLALAMVVGMLPITTLTAFAEELETINGTYTLTRVKEEQPPI